MTEEHKEDVETVLRVNGEASTSFTRIRKMDLTKDTYLQHYAERLLRVVNQFEQDNSVTVLPKEVMGLSSPLFNHTRIDADAEYTQEMFKVKRVLLKLDRWTKLPINQEKSIIPHIPDSASIDLVIDVKQFTSKM